VHECRACIGVQFFHKVYATGALKGG